MPFRLKAEATNLILMFFRLKAEATDLDAEATDLDFHSLCPIPICARGFRLQAEVVAAGPGAGMNLDGHLTPQ
jgi:hypothetical protein